MVFSMFLASQDQILTARKIRMYSAVHLQFLAYHDSAGEQVPAVC